MEKCDYRKDLMDNLFKDFAYKTIPKLNPKNKKTYIMVDGNGFYKIGKSFYPNKREKTLQSESPNIKLIGVCDSDIEQELHDEFNQFRIRGEWFDLNEKQISILFNNYNFAKLQDLKD